MDEENNSADYTVGIFQSIGFKEFHNYLKLGIDEQKGPLGQKLFEDGKEQMMLATRQVDSVVVSGKTRFVTLQITYIAKLQITI